MSLVGIIANPASGKDIRRLVAYGSVFDNQEKVRIVRRIILGLLATGIERICYMPDYYGIVRRAAEGVKADIPVFPVNFKATASQEDSLRAAAIMQERDAGCIVTLGGDGTNRAVAKGNSRVPILPVSTGTNNVFPYMVEGTLAGLAAGLVALRKVSIDEATFHSTKLTVLVEDRPVDIALVDAAVYDDPFVGSRAVWDMSKVKQVFLNRAEPDKLGLSSIGGVMRRILPEEPRGMVLEIGNGGRVANAPVAPGIIEDVPVASEKTIEVGEKIEIAAKPSILALDGEREVEIGRDQSAAIVLEADGPLVVDVSRTLRCAAEKGIFIR